MKKIDWNDISIMPSKISNINSRKEINPFFNGKLPIFSAPMDTVIDIESANLFNEKINICLPRNIESDVYFKSITLDHAFKLLESDILPGKILIDVANGNMKRLIDVSRSLKEKFGNGIELMVGNIANPETFREYCEIGVDYVRCGVGGGSACLTAQNVGIFYPMASLIIYCNSISKEYNRKTKIVADGGFREYSEIIKALACGADYVMIGGILSKSLESCSEFYTKHGDSYTKIGKKVAISYFKENGEIYKKYRGMSTKEVQRDWNRESIKTSEGIVKYNKIEYTFEKWIENFEDYLKSCMSYTNSLTLDDFIGNVDVIEISEHSYNRFNK